MDADGKKGSLDEIEERMTRTGSTTKSIVEEQRCGFGYST